MSRLPAIFQNENQAYEADTCEELKDASCNKELELKAWSQSPYPGQEVPKDYIPEIRSLGFWRRNTAPLTKRRFVRYV